MLSQSSYYACLWPMFIKALLTPILRIGLILLSRQRHSNCGNCIFFLVNARVLNYYLPHKDVSRPAYLLRIALSHMIPSMRQPSEKRKLLFVTVLGK